MADTIHGCVTRVYYADARFSAGLLQTDAGERVRFRGKFYAAEGDRLSARGVWQLDPKYGHQFEVQHLEYELPQTPEGLALYLSKHPAFEGIGPKTAAKIAAAVPNGASLDNVLRDTPEVLVQAGIPQKTVTHLIEAWNKHASENTTRAYLAGFGLTHHQMQTLIDRFGTSVVSMLKHDPYLLIKHLSGYGFKKVDAIINDDLDALKEIPFRIGEGAALTINRVFWTLWLSNPNNFFSTAHKNYKTGADTALSVDGLTLARQTFSKQRRPGSSGKADPLGVRPKILLVPASLEILADLLMNSTTLNEATSTPKSNRNPHTNKFQVVASDYLDNEDYAGSSAKTWYLLADPNAIPAIEVVFLNGKQVPTVEKSDMVFNRLGIEFRGYLDFGVKEQDFCGALKMKGEA